MQVKLQSEGEKLTVAVEGLIDTLTSPQLESQLKLDGVKDLVFDFTGVEYISSAGLRVLVKACKALKANGGEMKIAGVRPIVKEVFDITGFTDKFNLI